MMKFNIPEEVISALNKIRENRYKAYLVGGCVRDLLLAGYGESAAEPKDWDIATGAKPEEIQKIFPDSVYENNFGTVGVKTRANDPKLKILEITTFRLEGKYTDKRHPDEIKFAQTIEEDLARRDFTVNAIALEEIGNKEKKAADWKAIDPFDGQIDLKNKIIRAVGDPEARFNEDALRLMRAVRFAIQLNSSAAKETGNAWQIEMETRRAIEENAKNLERIAAERVRDELVKIIMCRQAAKGILMLEDLNLLQYVLPELRAGLGVGQNKHHIFTVFEHNVRALDYAAGQNYSLEVRLASLLHDVGKPQTKQGEGPDSTFYSHEVVGAKIAAKTLARLKFSKELTDKVVHLVRYHLFYYNVGEVTEAGVRRFLRRVGTENIDDLMKVREADRIGSGVPKAFPYKLRHLLFMIEKVKRDPISPKMLEVDGSDVMKILNIKPGPKVGWILAVLLEELLDDPKKNSREYLEEKIKELGELPESKLTELFQKAKEKKDEFESGAEEEIKKKYYVK